MRIRITLFVFPPFWLVSGVTYFPFVQVQVSNSSSRLKLRGSVTGNAMQHNFLISKWVYIPRYTFRLLQRALLEWERTAQDETSHKKASTARSRMIEAQDLSEQANQKVKESKERLMVQCKRSIVKMLNSHLAAAFEWFASRVQETHARRAILRRVLKRMHHAQFAHAFDFFHEVVVEKVRNRWAIKRILKRMLHAKQVAALHLWLEYIQVRRQEIQDEAHELAKRELSGELSSLKTSSRDLLQGEIDRRFGICKQTVKRMLAAQLAQAFDSFAARVVDTKQNRDTCKRVVKRILHRQLAGTFDLFHLLTIALRKQRIRVARAVGRWRNVEVKVCFDTWLEYLSTCGLEKKWAAWETVKKQLAGEMSILKEDFQKKVEIEKARRQQVCRQILDRMLAAQLAKSWDSYVDLMREHIHKRAVIGRVLLRMQNRQLAGSFGQYASMVHKCKMQRTALSKAISRMRYATLMFTLDAWNEYSIEMKDNHQTAVDIEAQRHFQDELETSCNMYKKAAGQEAERHLEVCTRTVKRMLLAHLAAAFDLYIQIVAQRIHRRAVAGRVLRQMKYHQLAAAFEFYLGVVKQMLAGREAIAKVVSRMQKAKQFAVFENWLDSHEAHRQKKRAEGLEVAKQRISGELETEREKMQAERDKHKEAANREARRRLEVCTRTINRMLAAHLAEAFDSFVQIVAERIHRRAVVDGVMRQMKYRQLAAAFDCYSGVVEQTMAGREIIAKVISRMYKAKQFAAFENWLECIEMCREETRKKGEELTMQRMSGVEPSWNPWQLKLLLTRAQHLPKMDLVGSVDPYVIFTLGRHEQRSSIAKASYNPEWNEEFIFEIQNENDAQSELVLTFMDKNKMAKDNAIGEIRLDIASLGGKSSSRSLGITTLANVSANQAGTSWRKPNHNFGAAGTPVLGKDNQAAIVTVSLSASNENKGDAMIAKAQELEVDVARLHTEIETEKRRRLVLARRVVLRMLHRCVRGAI